MKIKGRYSPDNKEVTYGEWTIQEIADFLKDGHTAMLSLSGYHIDDEETYASASALSLFPNEEGQVIYEEEDKIIIPTAFRRYKLSPKYQDGHPDELVQVNCIVDKNDDRLFVTIVKIGS